MNKLYILDDDIQYALLLKEVAEMCGWICECYNAPRSFLECHITEGILVLDLLMPDMDGIEVIRELSTKQSNMELILISGFDDNVLHSAQQLAEAHNFKVHCTLSKPLDTNQFMTMLDKLTQKITQKKASQGVLQVVNEAELEYAIKNRELVLYYQPQIEFRTKKLHGVEALLRWQHPKKGLIFPDKFIDLAEASNLIDSLTEEVINLAVEQAAKWKKQNLDIPISVNVSAKNILGLKLPEQLEHLVISHSITPQQLTLELTESAVMGELTSSLDVLSRLRMKGFSLSIDDFGTGHSSLIKLYQAPFTELKIDRSFIQNMLTVSQAKVITEACILLGKKMEMKIVAEGVEDQDTWNELDKLGCDIAQGFFISRAIPEKDLIDWLNKSSEYSLKQ